MRTIQKPKEGEYAPYSITYIQQVPEDGEVYACLAENLASIQNLIASFSAEKLTQPCAEGEWTIQEILVHVLDTERIFCYRALRFARNDATPLSGFEQDGYVPYTRANQRKITDILEEYRAVRQATLTFLDSLDEEALLRSGKVGQNQVSVRALAWMMAGHAIHHYKSILENYR